jgi:drug/metabolite transporter (DMT)-like permease
VLWFFFAFSSAMLSAAAAVTQKRILFRLGALEFSVQLAQLTLLLTLPLFFFLDYASISTAALLLLFFKTILGALAFLCVMQAIKTHELSGALPLMVLTPGLVAITAFAALGESLSGWELWGMLLLLAGTYLIELRTGMPALHPLTVFVTSRKHYPIVAALLLFTITAVLDRYLLTELQLRPLPMLAFQNLFLAFHLTVIALIAGKPLLPMLRPDAGSVWKLVLLVAVCTVGYRFAQIEAMSMAPVALVLAVKRLSVFMAAMLGGKFFRESRLPRKALAIIMLLAGATLVAGW